MYCDPSLIRKHVVKLSLNDNEAALVDALVRYTGEEKAAFIRGLLLERAQEVLFHDMQSASALPGTRESQQLLFAA